VTVTVGCGTGTLTVTVGAGVGPCGRPVPSRRIGTPIATISAIPMAPTITGKAPDRSRFRSFLRCLLPGCGACGVITPLMVARAPPRHRDSQPARRQRGREGRDVAVLAAGRH